MKTAAGPGLSPVQLEQFVRDGYVTVPDLIPPDVVATCRQKMWKALAMNPDDPRTWPREAIIVPHHVSQVTALCRTPGIETVAEQLVGPHVPGGSFSPVLNFPRPGPREFLPQGFHIDGIDQTTLFPVHRALVLLAYLTDTTAYGGALGVRPGSHRLAFEHWIKTKTEPAGSTTPPDLDYAAPLPVPGRAGDVVFLHYLLAHASSVNHDAHVRVALNGIIRPDPATKYPRPGPPQPDWTPLDLTLCVEGWQAV